MAVVAHFLTLPINVRFSNMDCAVHKFNFIHTAHRTCLPGEWTRATGTAVADTTCAPCKEGTFRTEGPTNTDPEQEDDVCREHSVCAPSGEIDTPGTRTQDTVCIFKLFTLPKPTKPTKPTVVSWKAVSGKRFPWISKCFLFVFPKD